MIQKLTYISTRIYCITDGVCAGTLIHEDIVLASASCDKEIFMDCVSIGGIQFDGSDGGYHNVSLSVPYNKKLSISSMKPMQEFNIVRSNPKPNSTVTVIGYGSNAEGVAFYQDLHEANITSYGDVNCSAIWKTIDPNMSFPSRDYLCDEILEGGKGDRNGDSGGPLYDINQKKIGIIAFGFGCARPNIPSGLHVLVHIKIG